MVTPTGYLVINPKSVKLRALSDRVKKIINMERLLGAAKELSEKVDSNETAAGDLLRQCESLQEELKAMKQVSQA